jgi:hypothetical protein
MIMIEPEKVSYITSVVAAVASSIAAGLGWLYRNNDYRIKRLEEARECQMKANVKYDTAAAKVDHIEKMALEATPEQAFLACQQASRKQGVETLTILGEIKSMVAVTNEKVENLSKTVKENRQEFLGRLQWLERHGNTQGHEDDTNG